MPELPERRGFNPPTQKNFDAIKDRLNTGEEAQATTDALFPVADTNIASPNNATYKTLLQAKGFIGIDVGANTYMLGSKIGVTVPGLMQVSGSALSIANDGVLPDVFPFDDADFVVASKTQVLQIRGVVSANATAPAINFTFGLHLVTVAGAADAVTYTYAAAVSGSTFTLTTPSASTMTRGVTAADFAIPADGSYALGVVTSGTIANNSQVGCSAVLQTRNT
jgi:hypothetical protein